MALIGAGLFIANVFDGDGVSLLAFLFGFLVDNAFGIDHGAVAGGDASFLRIAGFFDFGVGHPVHFGTADDGVEVDIGDFVLFEVVKHGWFLSLVAGYYGSGLGIIFSDKIESFYLKS